MNRNINLKMKEFFEVTETMIDNFVLLTSDKNSLHSNTNFSNRSAYGECIVHGMLPIMFLAKFIKMKGMPRFVIQEIGVNFYKPVFVNQKLCIQIKIVGNRLDFSINNIKSKLTVTEGSALLKELDFKSNNNQGVFKPMVKEQLKENKFTFDDIYKGQKNYYNFTITNDHKLYLNKLIGNKQNHNSLIETNNLLVTSLLSTFVGMRIPGQLATFTNFTLTFDQNIKLEQKHKLSGVVSFKSKSTRMIKIKLNVRENASKSEIANGSIKTRVNFPPSKMPTVKKLLQKDLDIGIKGKIALVTGSSRGIGETTAKLLALYGAKVVINYNKSENEAINIVQEIKEGGGEAIALKADVTDRKQVNKMISLIDKNFGNLNILINNAIGDVQSISFDNLSWKQIQKDMDLVLGGAFNCSQEAIKVMKKNECGKIINMSTIYTDAPPINQSKYVMAKSALVGLTRSLAIELSPYNIQVNMVAPSMVETDLSKDVNEIFKEKIKNETPMKRLAKPSEVAKAVLFLSSSLSSFTTGQKLIVAGGATPYL